MISLSCPCGKTLYADDKQAGGAVACADCGKVHVVPAAGAVQATVPREQPAAPPGRPDVNRPPAPTSVLARIALILGLLSSIPLLAQIAQLLGVLSPDAGLLSSPLLSVGLGAPAGLLGVLGLGVVLGSQGRTKGAGRAIAGMVLGLLGAVALPVADYFIGEETARITSSNNLKQIGLCMNIYHESIGEFPPAACCDDAGKPLLSWRVLILPTFDAPLYQQFKLDEPWDGPNNAKLLSQMPACYALPGSPDPPGYTHYRVFVGHGAAFDPPAAPSMAPRIRLSDFSDGAAQTILVVEAAQAAPWTKPDELDYDPDKPLPPLGYRFRGGFQVGMADATVHWVRNEVSEQTLRAAITRSGGETLGPDW